MHTCGVIIARYGFNPEDLCGQSATKSVVRHELYLAKFHPNHPGFVIWLCDKHYEHAAANWSRIIYDF